MMRVCRRTSILRYVRHAVNPTPRHLDPRAGTSVARFSSVSSGPSHGIGWQGGSATKIKIAAGNAHPRLARDIARHLGLPLLDMQCTQFKDGETAVDIFESVRDCDVFVVQPTCNPRPNDYIMELLIILDALRRAGAGRLTAVMPIYGYARQDRKDKSRGPISAKVVGDALEVAGVHRAVVLDLHSAQIQGFVNFPIDNLYGAPLIQRYFRRILGDDFEDLCIVSPDAGGAKRADGVAEEMGADLAIISKKRERAGIVSAMTLVGHVEGKTCVIFDDMCDSGGTLVAAADLLIANGAKQVYAAVSHGIFSEPAVQRIHDSVLKEMVCLDTIPLSEKVKRAPKIKVLQIAPLLAEAIKRIHDGGSLTPLFRENNVPDHCFSNIEFTVYNDDNK